MDDKLCGFEEIQFADCYLKFWLLSETNDARFVGWTYVEREPTDLIDLNYLE